MALLRQMRGQSVGVKHEDASLTPTFNHFKTAGSKSIMKQASAMGLTRVAGNIFINPSSQDLWKARNGKIVRLTKVEVDFGERAQGPKGDPDDFLRDALADLTF